MTQTQFDVAVVGAGIIGLSTALSLLQAHPDLKVALLEKGNTIAQQQTGHNSGVIHSGIYYLPGSLKAQFCVAGRASMVNFCQENEIAYRQIGKVIVATDDIQRERLKMLEERGKANGVEGLRMVEKNELAEMEPHLEGIAALYAPKTSIVNYQDVSQAYAEKVVSAGAEIFLNTKVENIKRRHGLIYIEARDRAFAAKNIVNCAGLHSDRVARMMGVNPRLHIIPFRGEYFTISKEREHLVKHLIYPVPDPTFPFLGVHFTHNMKGYVEAGPNAVLAMSREGYRKKDFSIRDSWETFRFPGFWKMASRYWKTGIYEVNRSLRKGVFLKDLQQLIPEIQKSDLTTGGSGVRAQAVDNQGNLIDDFRIAQTESAIHVLNAPSPGATSSLVIGKHIANLAEKAFSLP